MEGFADMNRNNHLNVKPQHKTMRNKIATSVPGPVLIKEPIRKSTAGHPAKNTEKPKLFPKISSKDPSGIAPIRAKIPEKNTNDQKKEPQKCRFPMLAPKDLRKMKCLDQDMSTVRVKTTNNKTVGKNSTPQGRNVAVKGKFTKDDHVQKKNLDVQVDPTIHNRPVPSPPSTKKPDSIRGSARRPTRSITTPLRLPQILPDPRQAPAHSLNRQELSAPGDRSVLRNLGQERHNRIDGCKETVQALDHKVCERKKKLNALKHITNTQRERLKELNTPGASRPSLLPNTTQNLRELENKIQLTELKCDEADTVMTTYNKIKENLKEESLKFQPRLDELMAKINKKKQELAEVEKIKNGAFKARDAAEAELQHLKCTINKKRQKAESDLAKLDNIMPLASIVVPDYNTCLNLPDCQIDSFSKEENIRGNDEDDSDDDDEVITRTALKRQSQLIIESRTKRKL